MRLSNLNQQRFETISIALGFVLQDLKAPASTAEVAKAIAARLETVSRADYAVLCQVLVRRIAPHIPQASQGPPDRRGRRHWTWRPKAWDGVPSEPTPALERHLAYQAGTLPAASSTEPPEWDT